MNTGEYIALLIAGYAVGQLILLLIVTFDTWGDWVFWAFRSLAPIWNWYMDALRQVAHR